MKSAYLLAIVIIGVGLWFLYRGYAHKSVPRILTGIAIMFVGVAQFFRAQSLIAVTLIAIGFMLFIASLFMLKKTQGRIMRPNEPRRRR